MTDTNLIPAPESPAPLVRLKRILVTTDFSDASRQALPLAAEFARQFGATLSLVHVFPKTLPAELSQIGIVFEQKRMAAEARIRLARLRETELQPGVPVETVVLEGGAAHEINAFAKASETDLIITSTHGHSGLKQVLVGSTAERIVRHAPCPVLVVREQPVPVRFPGDVLCRFQRILVPTDFSEAGVPALRYAAAFARPCGSIVTILHVIEPPPYPEFGYVHVPLKEAQLRQDAERKLESTGLELNRAGIEAASLVRTGSAFREIAACAGELRSDLIVIGMHGRGAIAHALLGSTAERVVRHAPCPVLVVHEREPGFLQG